MPADRPSTWHLVHAEPQPDGGLRLGVVWQSGCRSTAYQRCCDLAQHIRLDAMTGPPWTDITAPGVYRARIVPGPRRDAVELAVELVHP